MNYSSVIFAAFSNSAGVQILRKRVQLISLCLYSNLFIYIKNVWVYYSLRGSFFLSIYLSSFLSFFLSFFYSHSFPFSLLLSLYLSLSYLNLTLLINLSSSNVSKYLWPFSLYLSLCHSFHQFNVDNSLLVYSKIYEVRKSTSYQTYNVPEPTLVVV